MPWNDCVAWNRENRNKSVLKAQTSMSTVAPNSSNSLVRGALPMPAAWWRAARSPYLASTYTKIETVLGIHLQGTTLYKNVEILSEKQIPRKYVPKCGIPLSCSDFRTEDQKTSSMPADLSYIWLLLKRETDLIKIQLRLFAMLLK